jgi:hypothetical protein
MRKGLPFVSIKSHISINFGNEFTIVLETSDVVLNTGESVWHAGFALAKYLYNNRHLIKDKSIIEIGSGLGLVGLTAACLGAERVTFTDLDCQRSLIIRNIELNQHIWKNRCACQFEVHNFCDDLNLPENSSYDVLIGSDLGYDVNILEQLSKSISHILNRETKNIPVLGLLAEEVRWKDIYGWYIESLHDSLGSNYWIHEKDISLDSSSSSSSSSSCKTIKICIENKDKAFESQINSMNKTFPVGTTLYPICGSGSSVNLIEISKIDGV